MQYRILTHLQQYVYLVFVKKIICSRPTGKESEDGLVKSSL